MTDTKDTKDKVNQFIKPFRPYKDGLASGTLNGKQTLIVSERLQNLQSELLKHPKLLAKVKEGDEGTFTEALGTIAADCGIMLHGNYSQSDLERLYEILTAKLQDRRAIIIQPQSIM